MTWKKGQESSLRAPYGQQLWGTSPDPSPGSHYHRREVIWANNVRVNSCMVGGMVAGASPVRMQRDESQFCSCLLFT